MKGNPIIKTLHQRKENQMKAVTRFCCFLLLLMVLVPLMINTAYADKPKKGGELVGTTGQFPRHFNTAVQSGLATATPSAQIFSSLLDFDENWQPVPYMAKSWEVSDGGMAYTIHMVENVAFHDGKPVTSEDVAFSFEVVKNNHPFGRAMFAAVDRVETPDPHTAVFKLSRPHPALLMCLSPPLLPILPKHVYGDGQPIRKHPANLKPIGSGPFKFVDFKKGEYYVFERNENFFRPDRPYVDRFIARLIRDSKSREIALKQGKVHYMGSAGLRLQSVSRMKKDKNLKIFPAGLDAIGPITYLEPNMRKPPFNDVRVRQAMAYAIDRDFIINKLHHGLTTPCTGPLYHSSPFYTADVNKYDLDLEKANKLLDEAGYAKKANGIRFSANLDWLPGVPDDQQIIAEYLKPQLRKVGIEIVLRPPPDFGTWLKRVAGWEYDLTLNLPFNYPDPIIGVHRLYLSTNIKHIPWSNTQGYKNPKVDEILNKAAVEVDFEKRKALYIEFQKIITDELPLIYIHEVAAFTFLNKDLMGWPKGIWGLMGPGDGIYWREGRTPQ
jgi:peptide/nickel transport system substrate-binding protein